HRQVKALRLRVVAALDLAHPAPRGTRRETVLLRARDLTRVTPDTRVHREPEPVLLTRIEREQLRTTFVDAWVHLARELDRHSNTHTATTSGPRSPVRRGFADRASGSAPGLLIRLRLARSRQP